MSAIAFTADLPCWIRLPASIKPKLIESIKFGVRPQSYRRYDPVTNCWYVHMTWVDFLVNVSKRYYDEVDYLQLPLDWQSLVTEVNVVCAPAPLLIDYFKQLYVTQNAPEAVIKASFKALARLYHSDTGGTDDLMTQLNIAYDQIRKVRNF